MNDISFIQPKKTTFLPFEIQIKCMILIKFIPRIEMRTTIYNNIRIKKFTYWLNKRTKDVSFLSRKSQNQQTQTIKIAQKK